MSDHDKDALQYTLSQRPIRDGSIFRWGFDPAESEGLTVDKLREAKRQLLSNGIHPPLVIPQNFFKPAFLNESRGIDQEIFKMLTKKDEVMNTVKKEKVEKFNTIGVRFPESPRKEYTYKVRIGAKPHLGQELVADTDRGQAVVFVTSVHKTPKVLAGVTMKYIDRKAVAL